MSDNLYEAVFQKYSLDQNENTVYSWQSRDKPCLSEVSECVQGEDSPLGVASSGENVLGFGFLVVLRWETGRKLCWAVPEVCTGLGMSRRLSPLHKQWLWYVN